MIKYFQVFLFLAVLAVLTFPLSACNTVEGFGRDLKAAGEATSTQAQKIKGYN